MPTRILLADSQEILRHGIRCLLQADGAFDVVAETGDGRQAVQLAAELEPELVVMDTNLRHLSGVEATRKIHAAATKTRVLAMAAQSHRRAVGQMFQAGAAGYLSKDATVDELMRAIRTVAEGRPYLTDRVSDVIVEHYLRRDGAASNGHATPHLTPREREVLQLLAEGYAPRDIAGRLEISVKTIDTHRYQVMRKLKLRGVADLTRYAIREGITPLHAPPDMTPDTATAGEEPVG